jgi:hypothetical protein
MTALRRREFIVGLGAAAWPVVAWARQRVLPLINNRQGE